MPKFVTGAPAEGSTKTTAEANIEYIEWRVEVPWEVRRDAYQAGAIQPGGRIDTAALLELIIPCVQGWSRDEPVSPEAIWGLPVSHADNLAGLVGMWLYSGANMSVSLGEDGLPLEPPEDEAGPLASVSPG